ncbi:hypothetical protein [Nostoc sp. TCL26-01]|uniref:hypothetical protein n=1 Tax=Nostoc sp. TCL26-01 TaxID=2576904 RepID=UPI0015BD1211|nr:hypothetical protein [Nostoc sp. TCL26-01]QLE58274.1 hypothetical protein FD725_23815 [Nostoc sp. TCL26-01]
MRKRTILQILFALSLVGILGVSYVADVVEPSLIVSCSSKWGFIQTKRVKYYTSPQKIVIQPWLGQHQVYAIFQIPQGYDHDALFRLSVPGESDHCGGVFPLQPDVTMRIKSQSGHYLLQGYVNTRIALSLIAQGKFQQLNKPENWQVGYVKKN